MLYFINLSGSGTCKGADLGMVQIKREETFPKLLDRDDAQAELQSGQHPILENIKNYIRIHGRKSRITSKLIETCCASLEEKYFKGKIKKWIVGYRRSAPVDLIFVAIVTEIVPNVPTFPDFDIIQRKLGDVSVEAQNLFEKEKEGKYRFTSQESGDMHRCIKENAEILMTKHSNLLIVRGSKVRPGHTRPDLCIVLYVHVKGIIPFAEEPFPDEVGGYPVVVLEGIFHFSIKPKIYIPSLMMGCQLESGHGKCGSLGGFVRLPDGSLGCLTACHVFLPHIEQDSMEQPFNKAVYQPECKPHCKFGEVINHSFGQKWNEISVDAALIKITDDSRAPKSGRFPDAESTEAGNS